jgi:hypothetical protein
VRQTAVAAQRSQPVPSRDAALNVHAGIRTAAAPTVVSCCKRCLRLLQLLLAPSLTAVHLPRLQTQLLTYPGPYCIGAASDPDAQLRLYEWWRPCLHPTRCCKSAAAAKAQLLQTQRCRQQTICAAAARTILAGAAAGRACKCGAAVRRRLHSCPLQDAAAPCRMQLPVLHPASNRRCATPLPAAAISCALLPSCCMYGACTAPMLQHCKGQGLPAARLPAATCCVCVPRCAHGHTAPCCQLLPVCLAHALQHYAQA